MAKLVLLMVGFVLIAAFTSIPASSVYVFPELKFFPKMPVSETNPVTREGAELGRYLFYDPILSGKRNMSCASCHKQEFAFSDAPNSFTKGQNGTLTRRNTMALFNLAWYPSFFWNGKVRSLEEQIFHPVRDVNEMNLNWKDAVQRIRHSGFYKAKFKNTYGNIEIDSILIARSIGQFLRTLVSYQSRFDKVLSGKDYLSTDEYEGFVLMNDMTKGDCLHCHTTDADALGTTGEFSNNGLDAAIHPDEYKDKGLGEVTGKPDDFGKFKIPSLRNVALTAPYMHDGRFKTLEEVLDFYSEGVKQSINIDSKMGHAKKGGVGLTQDEKRKIIAFLHTLTDSTFIRNQEFSDPFKN